MDKIMMTTTTTSSVASGGIVPLTTISRRTGCSIVNGTNTILIKRAGYYKVDAIITFTAPVAGTVTMALQKNGVAIQGLNAATSVATASTEIRSLAISGIVRVFPADNVGTISLVNTGVGATISNVALSVMAV